jgi:hypothetical protein
MVSRRGVLFACVFGVLWPHLPRAYLLVLVLGCPKHT